MSTGGSAMAFDARRTRIFAPVYKWLPAKSQTGGSLASKSAGEALAMARCMYFFLRFFPMPFRRFWSASQS